MFYRQENFKVADRSIVGQACDTLADPTRQSSCYISIVYGKDWIDAISAFIKLDTAPSPGTTGKGNIHTQS